MTLEEIYAELRAIDGCEWLHFWGDGEIDLEGTWTAAELGRVLELHAAYMELRKRGAGNEG